MKLEKKVVIITGGASGFGEGIAQKFYFEGAKVIIADIDENKGQRASSKMGAFFQRTDVSNAESVKNLVDVVKSKYNRIDVLVNNAGITHLPSLMEDVSEEEFDRVFSVNSKSVYLTARYVIPLMKTQGNGVILNIASTAGLSPRPRLNWYNASKGWMITASKAMAVELAPYAIRVNSLAPVAGETPLLKSFLGEDTQEIRQKFISTIPLGRFSTPQDLGNAACFLCSDEASMITGVCMEVDGGRCI